MEGNTRIQKLFSVGAHFGYAPSRRHPSAAKYIFGSKGGTELIDLEQTALCLEKATTFIQDFAADRKIVLFVGGKAEARDSVRREASRLALPYVASRWIGGTLTNFSEIKKRLARLTELHEMKDNGEQAAKFTKKERVLLDREMTELETMFGGLRSMQKLPDALLVVDPRQERIAVEEAIIMHIPVIAILNTDCDTSGIAYPIPANDASLQSLSYILEELATAYQGSLGVKPPTEVSQ